MSCANGCVSCVRECDIHIHRRTQKGIVKEMKRDRPIWLNEKQKCQFGSKSKLVACSHGSNDDIVPDMLTIEPRR